MLVLSAAAYDTSSSPSRAVFRSVVFLPGQLLQEPEMDLVDFLKQFQMTLSRPEIINSRFNTAASRVPPAELPTAVGHLPCAGPLG